MYAVVSSGGKQLKVEKGTEAVVEKLDAAVGDEVVLDVLFVADGGEIVVGSDAMASAKVTAEVVEHFKGEKVIVFKFKKRKGYKRLKGHRQQQTRIRVTGIDMVAVPKKKAAAKPKVEKPKTDAAPAQCEALKADGKQCGNKAKEGSKYCGVHAKKHGG